VTPGQTVSQTFTLTNSGGSATGMLSVSLSGSLAFSITSDGCTGTALGKGRSCTVTVQYAPTTAGQSDSATLTASGRRPPASASITLTGSGGAPDLSLSPGVFLGTSSNGAKNYSYDFGPGGGSGTTFTVANNGTGPSNTLHVTGGDPPQFVLGNTTCEGKTLAPGGTCWFDVVATPPVGCNSGDPYGPAPFDVIGVPFAPYIHLDAVGRCP
jgi:hypothetical protein